MPRVKSMSFSYALAQKCDIWVGDLQHNLLILLAGLTLETQALVYFLLWQNQSWGWEIVWSRRTNHYFFFLWMFFLSSWPCPASPAVNPSGWRSNPIVTLTYHSHHNWRQSSVGDQKVLHQEKKQRKIHQQGKSAWWQICSDLQGDDMQLVQANTHHQSMRGLIWAVCLFFDWHSLWHTAYGILYLAWAIFFKKQVVSWLSLLFKYVLRSSVSLFASTSPGQAYGSSAYHS